MALITARLLKFAMAGILGAGSLAFVLASAVNPEAIMRSNFEAALVSADRLSANRPQQFVKAAPVAGTEDFWLSAMRAEPALPVTKAVSIGDQIKLSLDGSEQKFEVSAVSAFYPEQPALGSSSASNNFVLVTARDGDGPEARVVRFVMEITAAASPSQLEKSARAL